MFLWTYFHEQTYRVDLTPSTGKWGRPYSTHRQGIGDIICAKKAAHSNRLKCYYIIDWISLLL